MGQVHQQPFVVLFESCGSPAIVICFLRVEIHLEKFDTIFAIEPVVFSIGVKQAKFSASFRVRRYKSVGRLDGCDELFPIRAKIQNNAGIVIDDFLNFGDIHILHLAKVDITRLLLAAKKRQKEHENGAD